MSGHLLCLCGRSELPYYQAHSWSGRMYYSSWDVYRGQCTWLCQRSVNTCTKLLRCLKDLMLGLVGLVPWQVGWAVTRSCVSTPRQPLKMYESSCPSGQTEEHPATYKFSPLPPKNCNKIDLPIHSRHLSVPHQCYLHQLGMERGDCQSFTNNCSILIPGH